MKTKLPAARAPLPKFRSDEAAAEYFQTHSVAEVWNQLLEGKPATPSKALADAIQERHTAAKSPSSIDWVRNRSPRRRRSRRPSDVPM